MKRRNKKNSSRSNRKSSKRGSSRRYQKNALEERLKQSQQEEEGGLGVFKEDANITIWRPKDGDHTIDIIPYEVGEFDVNGLKPGTVHYTFRYWVHKKVGPANDWVICPLKTWGNPCPICEERQRLIDAGKDWDKYVKPLFARPRNIYNIVCYDRGEERKGVQVWDVSDHYFQKHIIKLSKKPARGGRKEKKILFFDEEEGRSISFTIEPAQSKEDYPEYIGHAFEEREEPIPDEIFDSVHTLDEIVVVLSYEEIKEKAYPHRKEGDDDYYESGKGHKSGVDYDELIDELDDLEDNDELLDFVDENELEIELKDRKSAFKKNKKAVLKFLEDMKEDYELGGDKLTADDIYDMNKRELRKFIKEKDLDYNTKDYDDLEDLKEEIIDELELEEE